MKSFKFVFTTDNKIVLYRIGDHIDISRGPMVGNTSFLGRCTVSAVSLIYKYKK